MIQRRQFLGLGLLSGFGLLLGNHVQAGEGFSMVGEKPFVDPLGYRVQYLTRFPRNLSSQEYTQIKSTFQSRDLLNRLEQEFRDSGRLLAVDFEFEGDHSKWILTFRDEESFLEWRRIQKTNPELKAHRELRLQAGFKTEIVILGFV